jgi:Homeodomain-like domain
MAAWRRAIELSLGDADTAKLRSMAQSRTEPASRVERARILLAYREDPSFFAVGRALGLHHQTVQRCVERAVAEGPMAALDDRPRPGRVPTITLEAKAWLVSLACRKAKDLGYPHELWTTRLLARHAREHGPREGHGCLANLAQGTVCKILDQEEVKPHKVRYYLEQRDPDFAEKMAEVLCVYRQVKILKKAAAAPKKNKPSEAVAIISYDEKPASRPSQRQLRICRPNPACMRPSHASMNINATARSACWPASISSPARSMPWSRIAIAAASSSNSSSFSMLPIRPKRRSS